MADAVEMHRQMPYISGMESIDLIRVALNGLTQAELARRVGIGPQMMSDIWHGRRLVPPGRIDAMAAALGMDERQTHQLHCAAARDRGYRV
jgi:transcriptional regulator with XRE-family HTH domain